MEKIATILVSSIKKTECSIADTPKRLFVKYIFGFMPTKPLITTERVDDLPVLITQLEGMGVQQLLGDRALC